MDRDQLVHHIRLHSDVLGASDVSPDEDRASQVPRRRPLLDAQRLLCHFSLRPPSHDQETEVTAEADSRQRLWK